MERQAAWVERQVTAFVRHCRDAGMNVTPQRLAIYRALLETEDHLSPEALYQRVWPRMSTLSLATVYKTLDLLAEMGLVRELSVISETKRYDARLVRHHHLVCTRCKWVADLDDAILDAVTPPRDLVDFTAETVSVQILGVCAACAALDPEQPGPRATSQQMETPREEKGRRV